MKHILLLVVLLFSSQSFAKLQDFEFYMDKSCIEMTDSSSQDPFISFVAREIRNDLGEDFCQKVIMTEESYLESSLSEQEGRSSIVGPAEYGKLIDSLYQYYESLN